MDQPSHFNLYKDRSGYWRWSLLAKNGRIIADSGEGYFNKADAIRGITLVKGAGGAPIQEV